VTTHGALSVQIFSGTAQSVVTQRNNNSRTNRGPGGGDPGVPDPPPPPFKSVLVFLDLK